MTPRKVVDGQGRAEGARYPSLRRTGSPASTGVPSELVRWGGSLLAGAGSPRTTRPNIPCRLKRVLKKADSARRTRGPRLKPLDFVGPLPRPKGRCYSARPMTPQAV